MQYIAVACLAYFVWRCFRISIRLAECRNENRILWRELELRDAEIKREDVLGPNRLDYYVRSRN